MFGATSSAIAGTITSSVYSLPLSSRSEQVCVESPDLLHTHLALPESIFIVIIVVVNCGREEASAMLSRNLKAVNITASELGLLEKACMQQPWMVDIAARALSQGSVSQQQLLKLIGKQSLHFIQRSQANLYLFMSYCECKTGFPQGFPQGK